MRIDPFTVVAAYDKTKLRPTRGGFYTFEDGEPVACAIGAILIANGVRAKKDKDEDGYEQDDTDAWYALARDFFDMPSSYIEGFTEGFDGVTYRLNRKNYAVGDRYPDGYADGREAARVVFKTEAPIEN